MNRLFVRWIAAALVPILVLGDPLWASGAARVVESFKNLPATFSSASIDTSIFTAQALVGRFAVLPNPRLKSHQTLAIIQEESQRSHAAPSTAISLKILVRGLAWFARQSRAAKITLLTVSGTAGTMIAPALAQAHTFIRDAAGHFFVRMDPWSAAHPTQNTLGGVTHDILVAARHHGHRVHLSWNHLQHWYHAHILPANFAISNPNTIYDAGQLYRINHVPQDIQDTLIQQNHGAPATISVHARPPLSALTTPPTPSQHHGLTSAGPSHPVARPAAQPHTSAPTVSPPGVHTGAHGTVYVPPISHPGVRSPVTSTLPTAHVIPSPTAHSVQAPQSVVTTVNHVIHHGVSPASWLQDHWPFLLAAVLTIVVTVLIIRYLKGRNLVAGMVAVVALFSGYSGSHFLKSPHAVISPKPVVTASGPKRPAGMPHPLGGRTSPSVPRATPISVPEPQTSIEPVQPGPPHPAPPTFRHITPPSTPETPPVAPSLKPTTTTRAAQVPATTTLRPVATQPQAQTPTAARPPVIPAHTSAHRTAPVSGHLVQKKASVSPKPAASPSHVKPTPVTAKATSPSKPSSNALAKKPPVATHKPRPTTAPQKPAILSAYDIAREKSLSIQSRSIRKLASGTSTNRAVRRWASGLKHRALKWPQDKLWATIAPSDNLLIVNFNRTPASADGAYETACQLVQAAVAGTPYSGTAEWQVPANATEWAQRVRSFNHAVHNDPTSSGRVLIPLTNNRLLQYISHQVVTPPSPVLHLSFGSQTQASSTKTRKSTSGKENKNAPPAGPWTRFSTWIANYWNTSAAYINQHPWLAWLLAGLALIAILWRFFGRRIRNAGRHLARSIRSIHLPRLPSIHLSRRRAAPASATDAALREYRGQLMRLQDNFRRIETLPSGRKRFNALNSELNTLETPILLTFQMELGALLDETKATRDDARARLEAAETREALISAINTASASASTLEAFEAQVQTLRESYTDEIYHHEAVQIAIRRAGIQVRRREQAESNAAREEAHRQEQQTRNELEVISHLEAMAQQFTEFQAAQDRTPFNRLSQRYEILLNRLADEFKARIQSQIQTVERARQAADQRIQEAQRQRDDDQSRRPPPPPSASSAGPSTSPSGPMTSPTGGTVPRNSLGQRWIPRILPLSFLAPAAGLVILGIIGWIDATRSERILFTRDLPTLAMGLLALTSLWGLFQLRKPLWDKICTTVADGKTLLKRIPRLPGRIVAVSFRPPWIPHQSHLKKVKPLITPLAIGTALTACIWSIINLPQYIVTPHLQTPRTGVLLVDTLTKKDNGQYERRSDYPMAPQKVVPKPGHSEFMMQQHFTPETYLAMVRRAKEEGVSPSSTLMYYWGPHPGEYVSALNLIDWSPQQLQELHKLGITPTIGIETLDLKYIDSMVQILKNAGFGTEQPLYVRLAPEPRDMRYVLQGSDSLEDPQMYKQKFVEASSSLRELGHKNGILFCIIWAAYDSEDFDRYMPPVESFDRLGYDLYVTPENLNIVLDNIRKISNQYPSLKWTIPEFGVATGGSTISSDGISYVATPEWAEKTLPLILARFDRIPSGPPEFINLFSIDVVDRIRDRHWNWAFTDTMFGIFHRWIATHSSPSRGSLDHKNQISHNPVVWVTIFMIIEAAMLFLSRLKSKIARIEEVKEIRSRLTLFKPSRLFIRTKVRKLQAHVSFRASLRQHLIPILISLVLIGLLAYIAWSLRFPLINLHGPNMDESGHIFHGLKIITEHHDVLSPNNGGAPEIYDSVAYMAYRFGTLHGFPEVFGGRLLNTIFGTLTVVTVAKTAEELAKEVYPSSKPLARNIAGFISGLLVAAQASAIHMSTHATYDAMSVFLAMSGIYFIVKNRNRWDWKTFALGPLLIAGAIATKYIASVILPMLALYLLIGLLKTYFGRDHPDGSRPWWQPLLLGLSIPVSLVAVFSPLGGLLMAVQRVHNINKTCALVFFKAAPAVIIHQSLAFLGPLLILTVASLVLLAVARGASRHSNSKPELAEIFVFFFGSLTPIAAHAYAGHMESIHHHLAFSAMLMAPIIGVALVYFFSKTAELFDRLKQKNPRATTWLAVAGLLLTMPSIPYWQGFTMSRALEVVRQVEAPDPANVIAKNFTSMPFDIRPLHQKVQEAVRSLGNKRGIHIAVLNMAYDPLSFKTRYEEEGDDVAFFKGTENVIPYIEKNRPQIIVTQLPMSNSGPYTELSQQLSFLEEHGYTKFARVSDPLNPGADAFIFINPSTHPMIAFTFDDGPRPTETNEELLRMLHREGIRGTFFIVGKMAQKYPNLVREIAKNRNEVANHTFTHINLENSSDREILDQLDRTRKLIAQLTGRKSYFYRPPGGNQSSHSKAIAAKHGYQSVLYDVNTADVEGNSVEGIRHSILARVFHKDKAAYIILMHTNEKKTVEALPSIIKILHENGFRFGTVSQLPRDIVQSAYCPFSIKSHTQYLAQLHFLAFSLGIFCVAMIFGMNHWSPSALVRDITMALDVLALTGASSFAITAGRDVRLIGPEMSAETVDGTTIWKDAQGQETTPQVLLATFRGNPQKLQAFIRVGFEEQAHRQGIHSEFLAKSLAIGQAAAWLANHPALSEDDLTEFLIHVAHGIPVTETIPSLPSPLPETSMAVHTAA